MCSVNEDNENCENLELPKNSLITIGATCRSCINRGSVVLRKKDVYCNSCFLSTEIHKFRSALGKTKIMKPQDKVLVAYSGSQSSTALLHLLHCGVKEEHHKKLLFSVFVLFIEEGALFKMEADERKKIVEKVKHKVTDYDFPLYISSLSNCFKESPILESSLIFDEKYDKKIIELYENVKSFSSKEDLFCLLRQKLILKAAEQLNCNKVFMAEVGTDLAIKLLSNFSLGRGSTVAFQTGFCDPRHPTIKVLRPLRDFTRKEIIFYNKFCNIEALTMPSLTTMSPSNISIQKLTEKFVTYLHDEFPSTVYTVFRTGEKLSTNVMDEEMNGNICVLCKDKVRTPKSRNIYTADEAAKFSRNISSMKVNNCRLENDGCCSGSCSKEKKSEIDALELEKFLCYGCTLIIRDMKSINVLPKETLQAAVQRSNFEAMKEQISEFLIEDSSEAQENSG